MGQHHSPEEVVHILALGESGRTSLASILKDKRISKSTYYRWKAKYIWSEQDRALIASAVDMGPYACQAVSRAIELAHNPELGESEPEVRQVFDTGTGDVLDADLEEAFFASEADQQAEAERQHKLQAKEFRKQLRSRQTMQWLVESRSGKDRVKVYGKLPLGEHTSLSLHLQHDLHWRLTHQVGGSLNQSINALVRYALDCLDAHDYTLHVFDANRNRPKESMPGPVKRLPSQEEAARMQALQKAIHPVAADSTKVGADQAPKRYGVAGATLRKLRGAGSA